MLSGAILIIITCQAKLKLFADDAKLMYTSLNVGVFDCSDLQQSLDLLSTCAKSWHLLPFKSIIPHPYFTYETQLTNSSSVTDLGILVDYLHSTMSHLIKLQSTLAQEKCCNAAYCLNRHRVSNGPLERVSNLTTSIGHPCSSSAFQITSIRLPLCQLRYEINLSQ